MSCGICIAVCPWARKNNWIHQASREIAMRDFTGLTHDLMLWGQKNFYPYPDVNDYQAPTRITYKERPWFLLTEDIFEGVSSDIFKS